MTSKLWCGVGMVLCLAGCGASVCPEPGTRTAEPVEGCFAFELQQFDEERSCLLPPIFVYDEPPEVTGKEVVACWADVGTNPIYLGGARWPVPGFRGCSSIESRAIAAAAPVDCAD